MDGHRALVLLLALAACDATSDTDATDTDTDVADSDDVPDGTCVSGETWTGGDRESPLMHPGRACITCHTREREGPRFAVAGTVYTDNAEPDDCDGAAGVTVEILNADDTVVELVSNAAGNFFSERAASFVFPIRARVTVDGEVREMATAQDSGDCNSCHTPEGREAAPGRVQLP